MPRWLDGYIGLAVAPLRSAELSVPPADQLLGRQETRAQVRACIQQLPENYRAVLMLRDIEELSTQEVARMLSMTPNAVKIHLHRARQGLLTFLRREYARMPVAS